MDTSWAPPAYTLCPAETGRLSGSAHNDTVMPASAGIQPRPGMEAARVCRRPTSGGTGPRPAGAGVWVPASAGTTGMGALAMHGPRERESGRPVMPAQAGIQATEPDPMRRGRG